MKRITPNTFSKLQQIALDAFSYNVTYSEAVSLWNQACYYNKLQNEFIEMDEAKEVVKSLMLFDEDSQSVKGFNIRANQGFSRNQWFKALLGSNLCTYSRQQLKAILV